MRYGDLEGQGKIYDDEGIMIPKKGECVLSTLDGYLLEVGKQKELAWRVEFFDGDGIFVLTDNRLVFLREPILYKKKFKFSGTRFATLSDWEYWTNRSNKAISAGAMEFVEIPYSEIEKVKNGKNTSIITIKSKEGKFRAKVDSKVGAELARLQNNETDDLAGGGIKPLICFEDYKDDE